MLRSILVCMALMGATGVAAQQGDPLTSFSDQDNQMNAAMDQARATLPAFLAATTDSDGMSMGNVLVKVAFDTNSGPEIIWIGPFLWNGQDLMTGLLSNQPNFMGDLQAGDQVDFTTDMVRDWSLVDPDGTMWGNYTTRVMLPELDDETATALGARLSPDPVPAGWN